MNCFLIDFENVKSNGLKGIERLTENDDVYIFYSDYANSITFDVHHRMNQSKAYIEFFRSTIIGKNSLDFQLVSYLGYLVAQMKYQKYFVITNDRGFESAIKFWKDFFKKNKINDISINRYRSIQDVDKKASVYTNTKPEKKVSPTLPTIDSEAEVPPIKNDKVIIDLDTPQTDKPVEKSIPTNSPSPEDKTTNNTKPNSNNGMFKNRSNPYNQGSQRIVTNSNNFKTETTKTTTDSKPNTITNTSSTSTQDAKPSRTPRGSYSYRPPRYMTTPQNVNTSNEDSENAQNNRRTYSSNYNRNNPNPNNRRPQNQTQPQNPNRKPYNNNTTPNKDIPKTTTSTQPKSFVFGKIDLNEDVQPVENIQSKSSATSFTTNDTNTVSKPKVENTIKVANHLNFDDLKENFTNKKPQPQKDIIKDTNSEIKKDIIKDAKLEIKKDIIKDAKLETKKDIIKDTKSETKKDIIKDTKPETKKDIIKDTKPETKKDIIKDTKLETKKDIIKDTKPETKKDIIKDTKLETKKDISKAKSKPTTKTITKKDDTTKIKRKVGRPRTRPIEDETKKPKYNKKFQGSIPNDKLEMMLEKVSKLGDLGTRTYDDRVKICKILAFSESKQECYKTFMSCFGKSDGVKIYSLVKQQSDAIKNIYTNN